VLFPTKCGITNQYANLLRKCSLWFMAGQIILFLKKKKKNIILILKWCYVLSQLKKATMFIFIDQLVLVLTFISKFIYEDLYKTMWLILLNFRENSTVTNWAKVFLHMISILEYYIIYTNMNILFSNENTVNDRWLKLWIIFPLQWSAQ